MTKSIALILFLALLTGCARDVNDHRRIYVIPTGNGHYDYVEMVPPKPL